MTARASRSDSDRVQRGETLERRRERFRSDRGIEHLLPGCERRRLQAIDDVGHEQRATSSTIGRKASGSLLVS